MEIATQMVGLGLLIWLVLIAGGILLQIFLSKRENKWTGLILPVLTFLYSLVMVCNVTSVDGKIPWGPLLASFVMGNIPTVVLLAIYWACREKFRKKSELDKMQIDDL